MSIDAMACKCWGCRPDLMAAEYARNNQVVPAHEMAAVAGTIARLKGELERVTVEAEAVREENDRLHKLVDDLRQGDGHQVGTDG